MALKRNANVGLSAWRRSHCYGRPAVQQVSQLAAWRGKVFVNNNAVSPFDLLEIKGNQYLIRVQNTRERQGALTIRWEGKPIAVGGCLSEVLPPVSESWLSRSYAGNALDLSIDVMVRVEEVDSICVEGSPSTPKHALPHVRVVVPTSVESLFSSVIDTGNALAGEEISNCENCLLRVWVIVHETLVGPRHLVVIIDKGDEVAASFPVICVLSLETLVAVTQAVWGGEAFNDFFQNEVKWKVQAGIERRKTLIGPLDAGVASNVVLQ